MIYIVLILLLLLITIICCGVLIFTIIHLFFWIKSGIPFLPSYKRLLEKADREIDWSNIKKLYDLGSGNGDVIRFFANHHKNVEFVGYEINPLRVWISKWKSRQQKNTKFQACDFLKKDFSDADLVFTFLLPKAMDKLLPKIKKEIKKGSVLVSNTFHFSDPDLQPEKVIDPEMEKQFETLYFFRF